MVQAAREAVAACSGKTRQDLEEDRAFQSLLIRALEVVGEAASRTSSALRRKHAEVSWRRMIDIRNRLIHVYFDIDLNVIWRTVTRELPDLIEQLETILDSEQEGLID